MRRPGHHGAAARPLRRRCTPSSRTSGTSTSSTTRVFVRPMRGVRPLRPRRCRDRFVQGVDRRRRRPASCAPATSLARAIQSGYLRAYALLLLIGVLGLGLYFLIGRADDDDPPVDRPLLLPLAAGADRLRSCRARARAGSRARGRACAVLGLRGRDARRLRRRRAALQYVTDDQWIPRARHPLLARGRRPQPVPDRAHRAAVGRRDRSRPRARSGTGRGSSSSTSRWPRPRCSAPSWRRTWRCSSSSST